MAKYQGPYTVRRLIAKLKKMPQDAFIGWQNHDQSDHEIDGFVGSVGMATDAFYEADEHRAEFLGDRSVVIFGS